MAGIAARFSNRRVQSILSAFSTCEISDALIKLGLPHGGHIPDIHLLSSRPPSEARLCGPAYTVQMVLASDEPAPRLAYHFVDTVPQGSVIVIDAPPLAKNAVWGGLMTAGAISRGAVGVVISGRCRDIHEHKARRFPVFARGQSTLGQSPFTRPSAINVPLDISTGCPADAVVFPVSVRVEPGDWIVGDEDGVVCVPKNMVEKVKDLATLGREIDTKCLTDIDMGAGVQESFRRHRGK